MYCWSRAIAMSVDTPSGTNNLCPRDVTAGNFFNSMEMLSLMGTDRTLPPLPLMVMAFSRRACSPMAVSMRKHSWMRSPAYQVKQAIFRPLHLVVKETDGSQISLNGGGGFSLLLHIEDIGITSAPKDRRALDGGKIWTRETDDAVISA